MFTIYDTENQCFSTVEEPDPSISYTYADYLEWKFEERLELFRGRIFRLAAPNTRHQVVAGNLFVLLKTFLGQQNCQSFIAPLDVRLPVKNKKKDNEINTVVQSDLCIVCDKEKIDRKGVCGAPDLVAEILSPGNSTKEIKLKFDLYQEAGVKEYWIIYPEEESIAVFLLNEKGKYDGAILYAGIDKIESRSILGLSVKLMDIFAK